MTHRLIDLPYAMNGLSPYLSPETVDFHYNRHHRTYLNNLNNLLDTADSEWQSLDLKTLVLKSHNVDTPIFNNAAQIWNHDFYWLSMMSDSDGIPRNSQLSNKIKDDFGSIEDFKQAFIDTGLKQFGSGWVWLVKDPSTEKLMITKTSNAENPLLQNQIPIITCDVWEHAYYLDYRHRRVSYLEMFLERLANWEFAEKNFTLQKK